MYANDIGIDTTSMSLRPRPSRASSVFVVANEPGSRLCKLLSSLPTPTIKSLENATV
jgi:hypothetical protein